MTTYYKATRLDGTDFYTGTVDYAGALASGEVIRHPDRRVRDDASTYLSVSIAAADCTGAEWPCRLFRVEPVGRPTKASSLPSKRCVSALRVVEELPAHLALGPNGEQVAAFIDACRAMTKDDWKRVDAAWAAAWAAARGAAWDAAWDAARGAARAAARAAAWDAAWDAARGAAWAVAWGAARAAAWDAARAIVTRDIITVDQYDILTQPFVDAGFAEMVGR
jgi:hypothetical protein